MLVNLANNWFNPERIDCISASRPPLGLAYTGNGKPIGPLGPGKNNHYVYVRMNDGSCVTVAYLDTIEEAESFACTLADTVNSALSHPTIE